MSEFEKKLLLKIGNIEGTLSSLKEDNEKAHTEMVKSIKCAFKKFEGNADRINTIEDNLSDLDKDFEWATKLTRGALSFVTAVFLLIFGWLLKKL